MLPVLERGGPPAAEDPTPPTRSAARPTAGGKPRLVGVDVARGLALLGMMATHALPTSNDDGSPTLVAMVASGRSVATFVLVAGVSLAFLSGGRRRLRGPERIAASAGLAVRAALIGGLGLLLGLLSPLNDVRGILPFYGLLFLLVIPLLALPPRALAAITAAVFALGPVLIVATADAGLPYAGAETDPTPGTLLHDPLGVLVQLLVTGTYPAVVYLGYLCAGLAIGRLDLSSRRVAWWLLGGGLALAVTARAVSAVLLHPLGGLGRLIQEQGPGVDAAQAAQQLLWEPELSSSWWFLALPAPHSHTPVDLVHTLGSAAALLGAALLVTRVRAVARVLSPLAAAGSLSLTLYSAHLVLLASGVLPEETVTLYVVMAVGALLFAVVWRLHFRQGPLEKLLSVPATAARRGVASMLAQRRLTSAPTPPDDGPAPRTALRVLAAVVIAAVLVVALATATRPTLPAAKVLAPVAASGAEPPAGPPPAEPAAPVADLGRYCALSARVSAVDAAHPDQPDALVARVGAELAEMPRVAPAEIRGPVSTLADGLRAEAGLSGVAAPDVTALERAEATVEAFEDQHCR